MFGGNFAPAGWMFCEGQLLPISDFETLFNLIGTTYGGDGQSTFALPDLRGRVPIHQVAGFTLAQNGGVETVTVTVPQIPIHTHALLASNTVGTSAFGQNNVLATAPSTQAYIKSNPAFDTPLRATAITNDGGSQPHSNLQPYLCVDWIISLFGIFPSQT
jgi:microcystin-dependent protein